MNSRFAANSMSTSHGEFRGDGSIGDPDTFLDTEFSIQVNIDSLSRLAGAYGVDDMPDKPAEIAGTAKYTEAGIRTKGPVSLVIDGHSALASLGTFDGRRFQDQVFSVAAHVTGGNGRLKAEKIDVRIGDTDIQGKVLVRKGDIPEIDVDVYSDRLVFPPFLEDADEEPVAEPEFEDGRLIPDVAMPVEALRKLNGSLDIDVGELQRRSLFLKDIELDARLRDGRLDISTARFKARSGELLARANLDASAEIGTASLDLVARSLRFCLTQRDGRPYRLRKHHRAGVYC